MVAALVMERRMSNELDNLLDSMMSDIPASAPKKKELTPQQLAFIEAYSKTRKNLMLEAVAGSGKTFTLVQAAHALMTPTLALAFNKRIADELAKKMPAHVTCKTMNSLGHAAFGAKIGKKLRLESNKIGDIIKTFPKDLKDYYWDHPEIKALINGARVNCLVPQGAHGLEASPSGEWEALVDSLDYDLSSDEKRVALQFATKVLVASIYQAWNGIIDFDDQLYMSVVTRSPFPRFNTVLIDEAQDLSPVQHEMLALIGGRVVAAGDPYQAIYGFRGALFDSMDRLAGRFSMTQMPLSVSFRCPAGVVKEAQAFVNHIESAPDAPAGNVITLKEESIENILEGDMVVCRKNGPLISLFFKLLREGKPSVILGREIGQSLKKLVLKYKDLKIEELQPALDQWLQMEIANNEDKATKQQLAYDKHHAILTVLKNRKPATVSALAVMFEEMFRDERSKTVLCSIHKAKGLEEKRVHFYGFDECPMIWKGQTEDEQRQELNLCYVAVTRSMDTLFFHPIAKDE